MNEVTNNVNLREYLARALHKLENGESSPAIANAAANLCGKVISSVRTDIEYYKLTGQVPNVPFIESTKNKSLAQDKSKDKPNA